MTETEAREAIRQRGLSLERYGRGWRVRGPGIDILFGAFESLHPLDLTPADHRRWIDRERVREA